MMTLHTILPRMRRHSYAWAGFAMVLFFCFLEGLELFKSGPADYFSDVWNVMDWGCASSMHTQHPVRSTHPMPRVAQAV